MTVGLIKMKSSTMSKIFVKLNQGILILQKGKMPHDRVESEYSRDK